MKMLRVCAAPLLALLSNGCDRLDPVSEIDCVVVCRPAAVPVREPVAGHDTMDERDDPTLVMSLEAAGSQFSCDAIPLIARKSDPARPRFGAGSYGLRRSNCRSDARPASDWFEVGLDQPEILVLTPVRFDLSQAIDGVNEFCLTKSARDLRGRGDAPADDPSGAWWWSTIARIERVCLPPSEVDMEAIDASP